LLHALEIAKELEYAIENCFKQDEKGKSDKFRQLISIFNEQPHFKTMLLNRDISSEELVQMKKEGFMSA
jgi:mannose/fructose/N-acetylgalactosamine-specific phosphotransferase system component IID